MWGILIGLIKWLFSVSFQQINRLIYISNIWEAGEDVVSGKWSRASIYCDGKVLVCFLNHPNDHTHREAVSFRLPLRDWTSVMVMPQFLFNQTAMLFVHNKSNILKFGLPSTEHFEFSFHSYWWESWIMKTAAQGHIYTSLKRTKCIVGKLNWKMINKYVVQELCWKKPVC